MNKMLDLTSVVLVALLGTGLFLASLVSSANLFSRKPSRHCIFRLSFPHRFHLLVSMIPAACSHYPALLTSCPPRWNLSISLTITVSLISEFNFAKSKSIPFETLFCCLLEMKRMLCWRLVSNALLSFWRVLWVRMGPGKSSPFTMSPVLSKRCHPSFVSHFSLTMYSHYCFLMFSYVHVLIYPLFRLSAGHLPVLDFEVAISGDRTFENSPVLATLVYRILTNQKEGKLNSDPSNLCSAIFTGSIF